MGQGWLFHNSAAHYCTLLQLGNTAEGTLVVGVGRTMLGGSHRQGRSQFRLAGIDSQQVAGSITLFVGFSFQHHRAVYGEGLLVAQALTAFSLRLTAIQRVIDGGALRC